VTVIVQPPAAIITRPLNMAAKQSFHKNNRRLKAYLLSTGDYCFYLRRFIFFSC
jgi:hypothetical protein